MADGRTLSLSPARRWIGDLMHFSRHLPLITLARRMQLADVAAARAALQPRPYWSMLFLKAYALVAARTAWLRRTYLCFPWPHLFEAESNVAIVAVERTWRDEPAVFFAPFRQPEACSIRDLCAQLDRYKQAPVESIGAFRKQIRLSCFPRPLRRLLWWWGLNGSGPRRVRYVGTFALSVTAGLGATALNLRGPSTTSLHYGEFDSTGQIEVRLTFDHRVLDGAAVARALVELEQVLAGEILQELARQRSMPAGLDAA